MTRLSTFIIWNTILLVGGYSGCVSGECSLGCVNCDDLKTCVACSQEYRLEQSSCLACPIGCGECFNQTHCKQCKAGYFSLEADHSCRPCSDHLPNCSECNYMPSIITCEYCKTEYMLTSNKCVPSSTIFSMRTTTTITPTATLTTATTKGTHTTTPSTVETPTQPSPPPSSSSTTTSPTKIKTIELFVTSDVTVISSLTNRFSVDPSFTLLTSFDPFPSSTEVSTKATSIINTISREINHTESKTSKSTPSITPTTADGKGSQTKFSNEESKRDIIIIAAASASGGAILMVLLGVGICCLKRHSRFKTKQEIIITGIEEVDETASFVNPAFDRQCQENLSTPTVESSALEVEKQEPFYAKPSKKRNYAVGTGSIGVDIKTNFCTVENDTVENDITEEEAAREIGLLEELEEDIPKVNTAGTQSTYYNTEGIKRSRIPVNTLISYIKDKKDYESEFEKLPKGLIRTCDEAVKSANVHKNRFDQIFAYDATRVVLRNGEYINANYVDGYDVHPAYIACLGPVKSAMNDFRTFWEMVWQERCSKIVMLTKLVEGRKMKCEQYWPDDGCSKTYGNISVKTATETVYAEFVLRELLLNNGTEFRRVTHYHYMAWSDKTVPGSVVSLLEFRDAVETSKTPSSGPMIIHCSAGIGRTGTYIALDILIKEGLAEDSVDIFGRVMALRGQRAHMVQNVDQYVYLHHAVAYALTCGSKPLDMSSQPSAITDDRIHEQFQNLQSLPLFPKTDLEAVAKNKRNNANRKGADIPGDHHRVRLNLTKNDYINAVYIDGYRHNNKYIAAQSPLQNHIEQFVSMLYEENITCIVDLEDEQSSSKEVGQYIPATDKIIKMSHFQIKCVRCDEDDRFTFKELTLSKRHTPPEQDKTIKCYQMKGWRGEACLPESQETFLHLLCSVHKDNISEKGCILVQCLNGAKKSGLFCALSIMLEKLAVETELSVVNAVCQVRGRRHSAVENIDQFKFCYSCIQSYLETSDSKTYHNIL